MDIRTFALEYLRVTLNLEKSKIFYLETRLFTCVGANWYHRENVDKVCALLDETELPSSLEQAAQRQRLRSDPRLLPIHPDEASGAPRDD